MVLDALAAARAAEGLAAQSLAWPAWDLAGGMAGNLVGAAARRMRSAGPPPLTLQQGMDLFDAAVAAGVPYLVPLGPGMTTLGAGDRATDMIPPLFRELAGAGPPRGRAPGWGDRAQPSGSRHSMSRSRPSFWSTWCTGRRRRCSVTPRQRPSIGAAISWNSASTR